VALDHRGHGETSGDKPPEGYGQVEAAEDVAKFMVSYFIIYHSFPLLRIRSGSTKTPSMSCSGIIPRHDHWLAISYLVSRKSVIPFSDVALGARGSAFIGPLSLHCALTLDDSPKT